MNSKEYDHSVQQSGSEIPEGPRTWQITRLAPGGGLSGKGPTLRYGVSLPPGVTTEHMARFVVFMNGRTEWIEKYAHIPGDLQLEDDIGFLTWDHRGQGASGGERAFIESYGQYTDDAHRITQKICRNKPYIVIAHSMGGLIALHAAMQGLIRPAAMVLSSPLLGLPERPVPKFLARPLSRILSQLPATTRLSSGAGAFTKSPFEGNALTSDFDRYEMIKATPYPLGGVKFGWVNATFEAIAFVNEQKNLERFEIPTLVLTGSDERVVDPTGTQEWIDNVVKHSKARIEFDVIHGARHELFSETPAYYQKAIDLVRQFID
jgi:lysophospholipase